jgi:DNA-directed RNA polymerase specialized sigma24 family protein
LSNGGDWHRLPEIKDELTADGNAEQTVMIHDLLDQFGTNHPRQAEVAKMRLFLRMTLVEIAQVINLSADTAESDWAFARAWLKRECGYNHRDQKS